MSRTSLAICILLSPLIYLIVLLTLWREERSFSRAWDITFDRSTSITLSNSQ